MRHSEKEISNAKDILESAGYFVENLWHVDDVKLRFECDDDTAQEILEDCVANDWIIEQINVTIHDNCTDRNLKELV